MKVERITVHGPSRTVPGPVPYSSVKVQGPSVEVSLGDGEDWVLIHRRLQAVLSREVDRLLHEGIHSGRSKEVEANHGS